MSPGGAALGVPSGIGAIDQKMEEAWMEKSGRPVDEEAGSQPSSKKVRTDVVADSASVDVVMETPLEIQNGFDKEEGVVNSETARFNPGSETTNRPSFRDSLLRIKAHIAQENVQDDVVSDEEDLKEKGDADCPVIPITREEKIRLRRPWRQALHTIIY